MRLLFGAFSIIVWVLFFTVRAFQDLRMVLSQDESRLISFELHTRKKFVFKTLVTVVLYKQSSCLVETFWITLN